MTKNHALIIEIDLNHGTSALLSSMRMKSENSSLIKGHLKYAMPAKHKDYGV